MASGRRIKRVVITSSPVKEWNRWSKMTDLPGAEGFTLHQVLKAFVRQSRRTSLVERAAAISFNVFMAIPPTMIFIFTLIPYLPISQDFINALYSLIRTIIPGKQNHTVIINFLNDFIKRPRNGFLSFGLLLALFFSSNAMMGILRSFDKDYEGFYKRKGIHKRRTALKLTLIVFVLIFFCLLLFVARDVFLQWIGIKSSPLRTVIKNVRWVIIVFLVFYFTSIIYHYGPALRKRWSFVTPGSVFATTLTVIATALVSFWVNHFSNYNKLYGSISAVFILMSLIYVNSLVILLGFELNVTIAGLKEKKDKVLYSDNNSTALNNPH